MSSGRLGIVVVVVEVVVDTSMATVVVVVVVEVVVVEVVVVVDVESVVGTDGQDCVATVGTRRAGTALSTIVVDVPTEGVDALLGEIVEVSTAVVVGADDVSNVTRARESAGATAGASLCVHVSSWSMTAPRPLLRAHDATFCCNGSFGCART